jgi:phosphatidylglycerophosphatase A
MITQPANAVISALDDLVAAIQAAGCPCTRNPDEFQPPGAIVTAPTFVGGTLSALTVNVPVYFVTPDTGQAGVDEIIGLYLAATPALGTRDAVTTLWVSPLNPDGLPAYVVSVTITIEG